MFTDFYFKNGSSFATGDSIVFFQKKITAMLPNTIIFTTIENCQYGWSHKVRVFWDLKFRFIKKSRNISPVYDLKTTYKIRNKFFFISKEGTITVQQSNGNGKQIIDFEQIKGNDVLGVQFYRGKFLIGEQYFRGKYLSFQIDTTISVAIYNHKNKLGSIVIEDLNNILDLDFISLKSVYITLTGNINKGNKVQVDVIKKW